MKTTIEIANPREGEQIRAALGDPHVHAFVLIMGELMIQLPSASSRRRVLWFLRDQLQEQEETDRAVFRAELAAEGKRR